MFFLKWAVLLFCLVACACLTIRAFSNYKAEQKAIGEKEIGRVFIKLLEIERATNGALEREVKGIYLNYQGRLFPNNYHIHSKVLFKELKSYGYKRCFLLSIQTIR